MKKNIQISVPQPCTEDWTQMSLQQRGRFCESCQTTVIDFTKMADQELVEFFKKPKGNTCGHFKSQQLDRALSYHENTWLDQKSQRLVLGIGALLSLQNSNAQHLKGKPAIHYTEQAPAHKTTPLSKDSVYAIEGLVLDSTTKEPLIGATISTNDKRYSASTDTAGKFRLEISSNLQNTSLEIEYLDYHSKSMSVYELNQHQNVIELSYDIDPFLFIGGKMGFFVPNKRRSWFRRNILFFWK
jgi:hypothetical protein